MKESVPQMTTLESRLVQDCVKDILGIGFRLLGNSRNSDSVVSTASATVRQVHIASATVSSPRLLAAIAIINPQRRSDTTRKPKTEKCRNMPLPGSHLSTVW